MTSHELGLPLVRRKKKRSGRFRSPTSSTVVSARKTSARSGAAGACDHAGNPPVAPPSRTPIAASSREPEAIDFVHR